MKLKFSWIHVSVGLAALGSVSIFWYAFPFYGICFLFAGSVSFASRNVYVADPTCIWADPDLKRGSADTTFKPGGSGNIG